MLLIFSRWKPSSTGLFCYARNEVVVEHSGSLNLPTVKSETVFKAVVQKELPWYNLMAVLMNSCSAIRGSKNGFEIKLRESVAPALIDMDGDSCQPYSQCL